MPSSQFVDELAADEADVEEFDAVDESVPLPVVIVEDDLPEPVAVAEADSDETVDDNDPVEDEFDDELLALPMLLADEDVVTDEPDVGALADADVAVEAEEGGGC